MPTPALETWDAFLGARADRLRQLAGAIAHCVARQDTRHPAFHGCIDWHSAVHGTWALLAIGRLTGEPRYRRAALDAVGDPARVHEEEAALRAGLLAEEEPYGFAWAQQLDVEAAAVGLDLFHGLGSAARDALVAYMAEATEPSAILANATCPAYQNLIWPIVALHRWAWAFDDVEALRSAERAAARVLEPDTLDAIVAATSTRQPEGFFSPCHLTVLLAAQTGRSSSDIGTALAIVRRTQPYLPSYLRTPHTAGLNFSMAWGCHAAWTLSGDESFLDRYVDLVVTHLHAPSYWRDDYARYGHWVAQFGTFAVALSFEGRRPQLHP